MTNWYRFKEDIYLAPTAEGVYLLGDNIPNIIYAGRADNIRERLDQHPDQNNPCLRRKIIRYFAYETNNDSENREQELIDRYDPECNRT
jgi:excinuclease UvrABC nuclease subunit